LRLVALEDPTHHFWRLLPITNHFHLTPKLWKAFLRFTKFYGMTSLKNAITCRTKFSLNLV